MVALQLPNILQFLVAYFGALKAGLVVLPLNPLLMAPEIEYHLTDSSAALLVGFASMHAEAAKACETTETPLYLVSLTDEESTRRVRDYSLGMRQRLGIATALIGDPEVLVLDEPANGLDPAGIRWMRDLLRGYADQGGTVLLSSHLLHEIEVVADDLVVIGNGRIVASGTKGELLASAGTYAAAPEPATLAAALTSAGHAAQLSLGGIRTDADTAEVGRVALAAGVPLTELRPADGAGLEEMFLELTADNAREDVAA